MHINETIFFASGHRFSDRNNGFSKKDFVETDKY